MIATFSLHSVVNSVGGYAGLAALVGLALLVLLYFAQARELRRLSDWVDAELERRRVMPGPIARPTVIAHGTPPPPPTFSNVTTAVPGVRRVAVPAAAAAVAGAAAATGTQPSATQPAPAATSATPTPVGAQPAPAAPTATPVGAPAAPTGARAGAPLPGVVAGAALAPATAAAIAAVRSPGERSADADEADPPGHDAGAAPGDGGASVVAMAVPVGDAELERRAPEAVRLSGVEGSAGAAAHDAPEPHGVEASGDAGLQGAAPPEGRPDSPDDHDDPRAATHAGAPPRAGDADGPDTEEGPAVPMPGAGPAAPGGGSAAPGPGGGSAAQAAEQPAGGLILPGEALGAAAVPLAARRIPTAEPRAAVAAGADSRTSPPSPFDLLRAEPAVGQVSEAAQMGVAESASVGPSSAAGTRSRFPPSPPVRVPPLAAEDATVRAAGRYAPGLEQTEPAPRHAGELEDDYAEPPRSFSSTLKLLIAAIAIVAVLIFVATRVFGSGGSSTPPPASTTSQSSQHAAGAGPAPRSVRVAVLNGTGTSHLASGAWAVLAARGFRHGAIANAPAQGVSTSVVGYTHGHRAAALAVARDLSLSPGHVSAVDAASLADAERNGHTPQVVVTLGADYAGR